MSFITGIFIIIEDKSIVMRDTTIQHMSGSINNPWLKWGVMNLTMNI